VRRLKFTGFFDWVNASNKNPMVEKISNHGWR